MKRKIKKSEIKTKEDKWCTLQLLPLDWPMVSQSLSSDLPLSANPSSLYNWA